MQLFKELPIRGACLLLLLAMSSTARADFLDSFDSPTLDPAWQVVEFTGTRVYGLTSPANHISLTDRPGYLRYSLDTWTHFDGFWNGYQTDYHSCCLHDPGLELQRAITGDQWTVETRADYYLPYTNGRYFALKVYFGDGDVGTVAAEFLRGSDLDWNGSVMRLGQKDSDSPWTSTSAPISDLERFDVNYSGVPDLTTLSYRLQRNGGQLTALWSDDGMTWNTAFSRDLGSQLAGLDQTLVITGLGWATAEGSYADYDYVSVTGVPEPGTAVLLLLACGLLGVARALRGSRLRRG